MANIAPVYSCIDKGFKENAEGIPFQSKLPDIKHFSAQGIKDLALSLVFFLLKWIRILVIPLHLNAPISPLISYVAYRYNHPENYILPLLLSHIKDNKPL